MWKRAAIILCLLITAGVAAFWWFGRMADDSVYKGRRLSVWLESYEYSRVQPPGEGVQEQDQAVEAVRALGTNALPTLLRMLREKDFGPEARVKRWLMQHRFLRPNTRFAIQRNREAAMAFETLGSSASNAVPDLLRLFQEKTSALSRYYALRALGSIGPPASAAVPLLAQMAENDDFPSRLSAVYALGKIHRQPEIAIPALVRGLNDGNHEVRLFTLTAVAEFGQQASNAAPSLMRLLHSPDAEERNLAQLVLRRITPRY